MDKLLEIINQYVPDTEQESINSLIGEEIRQREERLKIDLSKKYSVNFQEEDVEKAFSNKNFVRKSEYEGLLAQNQEYETKLTEFNEQVTTFEKEKETFRFEKEIGDINIQLLSQGFNPDRLESIKPNLIGEGSVEEKVERIKSGFPELFADGRRFSNTTPKKQFGVAQTDAEKFFQERNKMLNKK